MAFKRYRVLLASRTKLKALAKASFDKNFQTSTAFKADIQQTFQALATKTVLPIIRESVVLLDTLPKIVSALQKTPGLAQALNPRYDFYQQASSNIVRNANPEIKDRPNISSGFVIKQLIPCFEATPWSDALIDIRDAYNTVWSPKTVLASKKKVPIRIKDLPRLKDIFKDIFLNSFFGDRFKESTYNRFKNYLNHFQAYIISGEDLEVFLQMKYMAGLSTFLKEVIISPTLVKEEKQALNSLTIKAYSLADFGLVGKSNLPYGAVNDEGLLTPKQILTPQACRYFQDQTPVLLQKLATFLEKNKYTKNLQIVLLLGSVDDRKNKFVNGLDNIIFQYPGSMIRLGLRKNTSRSLDAQYAYYSRKLLAGLKEKQQIVTRIQTAGPFSSFYSLNYDVGNLGLDLDQHFFTQTCLIGNYLSFYALGRRSWASHPLPRFSKSAEAMLAKKLNIKDPLETWNWLSYKTGYDPLNLTNSDNHFYYIKDNLPSYLRDPQGESILLHPETWDSVIKKEPPEEAPSH